MSSKWDTVRSEFPALENWTFLNTATFGQLPKCATEAVAKHLAHRDEMACADWLTWYDDADRMRGLIGRLIGCAASDIAFITTASSALSMFLAGIDWKPGDRVVTLENEFPNNIYSPAVLAKSSNVEFIETSWERFYENITPATRAVLMSSASYVNGFVPPLAEIAKYLRERGVLFYVDGTQTVGALKFDVREIQPDLLAVNGYKWLLSPNGAGFLYVRPDVRQWLQPNVIGWRSDAGWRNVAHLNHAAPQLMDQAERYEGGMLNFPSLYAMAASVEMMLKIGPEAIERRVLDLSAKICEVLKALGATIAHEGSPILAARLEGRDASELARKLKEDRVLVSARHGNLRVSVHFYNNETDVVTLARRLRDYC